MPISGKLFIGAEQVATAATFQAVNAATGESLQPSFSAAGNAEVERACALAWAAFEPFRALDADARARFLETIADRILALGDELLERGHAETGLPIARLTGERGRTMGQLRLFADELRKGGWLGLRVDPALPDRKPLPRSDLRQRKVPLGPVVVFGASNFPLAFSVAGGDTAAALAAGCPVIVKGHSAHPGTSDLVAQAVTAAVKACDLPAGVFSLLNGNSRALGAALVAHPRVKAVGFTGLARRRPRVAEDRERAARADSCLRGDEQHQSRVPAPRCAGRTSREARPGLRRLADAGRRAVLHESGPARSHSKARSSNGSSPRQGLRSDKLRPASC